MIISPISVVSAHVPSLRDYGFNLFDDAFQLRRRHRPLFRTPSTVPANFFAVRSVRAAVLLDQHIRDLVDPLVRGEARPALSGIRAAGDRIADAASRESILVVNMRAKRTLHGLFSSTGHNPRPQLLFRVPPSRAIPREKPS